MQMYLHVSKEIRREIAVRRQAKGRRRRGKEAKDQREREERVQAQPSASIIIIMIPLPSSPLAQQTQQTDTHGRSS